MALIPLVAEWEDGSGRAVHHGILTELLDNGPGGAGLAVIISHHQPHPSSRCLAFLMDSTESMTVSPHLHLPSPPPDSSSLYLIHCRVNKTVSDSIIRCFDRVLSRLRPLQRFAFIRSTKSSRDAYSKIQPDIPQGIPKRKGRA